MKREEIPEWGWKDTKPSGAMSYLLPEVERFLPPLEDGRRVLDIGCGNGFLASCLHRQGWEVVGVDVSAQGVSHARRAYPDIRFEVATVSDTVLEELCEDPFDIVVSTEVVEHLYSPWVWARGAFNALRPDGVLIASTPYHGYLKNLMISLAGRWDRHMNALRDGGHIKMWSKRSFFRLLSETGFEDLRFRGAGRYPWLWRSMVVAGRRPADGVGDLAQSHMPK